LFPLVSVTDVTEEVLSLQPMATTFVLPAACAVA